MDITYARVDARNRVMDRIATIRGLIASGKKPDGSPLGDIVALEAGMTIDLAEYVAYQNAKSRAQVMGRITVDEAMTVYAALGGEFGDPANGGWGSDADLATKVAVTMLMGQLI